MRLPKIVIALSVQLFALGLLALAVTLLARVVSPPYPDWALVLAQASLAAVLSCRFGLPCWWRIIQFLMPIGLYLALMMSFNPLWALFIFIVLWLVFKNAVVERVPLYLTNSITRQALKQMVRGQQAVRFIDLGCGLGTNVFFMQSLANVARAVGVETALMPYWIARLQAWFKPGEIRRQDLWQVNLADYDLVYAFLSPEPMAKLWQKAQNEMRPGARLVSNSFALEGVEPSDIWQLADRRQTQLFIYVIPPSEESADVSHTSSD